MPINLARRNLLLYLMQYGVRFLSPVLVAPYLAKTLGPSGFADYVLWNSTVWTAVLLMEFGFYIFAINITARAETPEQLSRAVSSILSAKLLLAPLAITCFLLGTYALGLAGRQPLAVAAGAIAVFFYGMTFGWYFQGLQRGVVAVLLEAVPQFIQLVLVLFLIQSSDQMWLVAVLQTSAGASTTLAGWILLRRNYLKLSLRWAGAVEAIRDAFPYFIERASYAIYATATPILISVLSNPHQTAFYGLAEKVNIVLTALVPAATSALSPVVARRVQGTSPDWSLSIKIVSCITAATFAGSIVMGLAIGPIIERFLGPEFRGAIPVAQCFCVVATLMAFQLSVSNFIILQAGRASLLIRTSFVALLVTLGAQIVLVPTYGALGSAVARACAELAIGLMLGVTALRVLRSKN